MNGNQVGLGVGISWEFGNRVSPGRHRIRLAGMQRGRAQDFRSYSPGRVSARNLFDVERESDDGPVLWSVLE